MEGGEINSNVQKGLCVLSFPLKTSSNWSAAPSPSIYNLILQNGCILYISAIIKQSTIKMQHLEINPMFAHYHRTSRILSLSLLRSTQLLTFLPMNLINVYFQRSWHLSSQMCYSLLPFWHNHKPQLLPQKKKKLNVYCNKNQPSLTKQENVKMFKKPHYYKRNTTVRFHWLNNSKLLQITIFQEQHVTSRTLPRKQKLKLLLFQPVFYNDFKWNIIYKNFESLYYTPRTNIVNQLYLDS